MLQYTITDSPKLGMTEQARMAVEAGCSWIELETAGLSDEKVEQIAGEIIPICREAGVIMVFTHHDVMLDKLRVHGIQLSAGDMSPLQLREKLGGHPIIGVDVTPASDFIMYKRADVDYVVSRDVTPDAIRAIREKMAADAVTLPVVAQGRITAESIPALLEAGANGFNINIDALEGPEYAVSLAKFINICASAR